MTTMTLVFGAVAVLALVAAAFVAGASLGMRKVFDQARDADMTDRLMQDRWIAEREHLEKTFFEERRLWALERRELCSRIQAYDPNPEVVEPDKEKIKAVTESSQPEDIQKAAPRAWTAEDVKKHGLVVQEDGVVYDPKTNAVWEDMSDWLYWTSDCRKRGYPDTLNPGVVEDEGYEAALAEAKARHPGGTAATAAVAAGTPKIGG